MTDSRSNLWNSVQSVAVEVHLRRGQQRPALFAPKALLAISRWSCEANTTGQPTLVVPHFRREFGRKVPEATFTFRTALEYVTPLPTGQK
ncbi:hypothetical protein Pla100_19520 [Neorhodopirellula pilleata]|uniref:Uncharacterized protein n=1 Tax=Neorhodopirellula pilleata TaxID=2714738 RepID=A0A5C6AH95_9BACT|nr:hypothetical protein Pla100_19520 [Neorhodopirellula pilleata]